MGRNADTKSLLACRKTCHDFNFWVEEKALLWSRMPLVRAVRDNKVDICQKNHPILAGQEPCGSTRRNSTTSCCRNGASRNHPADIRECAGQEPCHLGPWRDTTPLGCKRRRFAGLPSLPGKRARQEPSQQPWGNSA